LQGALEKSRVEKEITLFILKKIRQMKDNDYLSHLSFVPLSLFLSVFLKNKTSNASDTLRVCLVGHVFELIAYISKLI